MTSLRNIWIFGILVFAMLIAISCNKQTAEEEPQAAEGNFDFTYYFNQTGNPDANGLLALITSKNSTDEIAVYGTYTSDGNPDKPLNVRYYKTDGDTVFNFLLDEETGRLHTSIIEVNGQRSNVLVKYEYPGPPHHTRISVYDYDWTLQTGELVYSANYIQKDGGVLGVPNTIKSLGDLAISIASAMVVVKGITAVGAGVGALAVSIGVSGVLTATAVVGTFVIAALTSSEASANDSPLTSYPDDVPVESPIDENENQNIPPNPCLTSDLNVVLGIDPGNELVAIAQGGSGGPYNFYWSSGETATANTYHSIFAQQDGVYYVVAVDQLGCAAYNSEYIGNMSVIEKLKQWGPWRSQNTTLTDNEIPGFVVFSFTGLDCNCFQTTFYEYTDIENDIFQELQSNSYCLSQFGGEMNFIIDDENCPSLDPQNAGQISVSSIAPLSLQLNDDGFIWNCVPF